ncbi:MAG: TetR/AcrR family transcriptional regulator [Ruminococcus sp.]
MKSDKKERILNATEQLMCVMPDREISVNLIAEKAGIGKGSVYYYFESKEEILYAVIERCYKKAIHEYFGGIQSEASALEKIKVLFQSMIKSEFHDNQKNLIRTLHLHESTLLHNQMKLVAIQELSPIMEDLLIQGIAEGSVYTETPKESAEMIVAVITFFLDNTVFPEDPRMGVKLKIFSNVLDTCLHAAPGSFDFLWEPRK